MGNVLDAGFDQIYTLYNSQVYATSDIIDTWVYRTGLEQMNYSLATAVGLFKSVFSMIMVLSVNAIARKWEESLW
jgi:putative aldouronate transport system permease protein